jgi:tRNA-specific 2-thiouridylase
MSGGVDSSVSAAILQQQGYEVIGVTMRLFHCDDDAAGGPLHSVGSKSDAAAVAERIGIEHHVLDLAQSFEQNVIEHFISQYERGFTPIPCVHCNSQIKFKDLLSYADQMGCQHIATGHYAIVEDGALYRGIDREKEQTYFLWAIERTVLDRLVLPLGRFTKAQTREMAREFGLKNAEIPESVEICFVPNDDYMAVLEQHLPEDSPALSPGPIVNQAGEIVGVHNGFCRYTVGQRRGLPGGFPEAMYVTKVLPEKQTVVIGTQADLFGDRVHLREMNWLAPPLCVGNRCQVRTRYRSRAVAAVVRSRDDAGPGECRLDFVEPVRAITPGQSGVLYDERERVIGGGIIQ